MILLQRPHYTSHPGLLELAKEVCDELIVYILDFLTHVAEKQNPSHVIESDKKKRKGPKVNFESDE
jgi:hypothetical protein